ncbi:MAG: isoprenylcysteine carboxylmethyltransferase family protein [Anaerolineae bacterium]|nr:isoprenylcysteine carboxylmethyltransferase family protein [Anaerolineae bacterium]
MTLFEWIFLLGLVATEVVRMPHRLRIRQLMREGRIVRMAARRQDVALDMLAYVGMAVIPLVYLFSPWLDFANTPLPGWLGWLGTALMVISLAVLVLAHRALGKNWSPTLHVLPEHKLVTDGIYHHIRHPIYASIWLALIAQAMLLPNWLAGLAGIWLFLPVWVTRLPREEQMMLDTFGEAYLSYMSRTGQVLPRLKRG